ncbi:MAG: hypothetical protein ACOH2S_10245 [Janthinobacterium svalbardensis]
MSEKHGGMGNDSTGIALGYVRPHAACAQGVEMRENQAKECIFFKKQQVLE